MNLLYQLRKKSPPIRKGLSLLKQILRFSNRYFKKQENPYSVMANSFPKSGTHLLNQILEVFPNVKNYSSFIATTPSIRFRERSEKVIMRRINWIVPSEVISSHLYFKPIYLEKLREKKCIIYFIYRDLRDVAISEAFFLTYMHKWHKAHWYFRHQLHDDHSRILCAIRGIPPNEVSYEFPNIAKRFDPYRRWIDSKDVFAVKYEDLVSSKRNETLRDMINFFIGKSGLSINREELLNDILNNINPQKSVTFRQGGSGGWRKKFTQEHKDAMKEESGYLLIELGYEKDLNW